jgi:hypothetical protein
MPPGDSRAVATRDRSLTHDPRTRKGEELDLGGSTSIRRIACFPGMER